MLFLLASFPTRREFMSETSLNFDFAKGAPPKTLKELFAADPGRLAALTLAQSGLYFDFSKTHLTPPLVSGFEALASHVGLASKRDDLFAGRVVNPTEGRAAEHTAERGQGAADSVARARGFHQKMRALIEKIESRALGDIKHVLHIGIGGSALGPDLLIDALGRDAARYDAMVVSNVDGAALKEAFARFNPAQTLLVIASKTFTTTETMLNAKSAIDWLGDPGRAIALTANPQKALQWGITDNHILPFSETVGGRYSLWSSIGFPAALALGWSAFEALLAGAAEMDHHFCTRALHKNAPFLAACADLNYVHAHGCETRAVFAYDERLRLLPSYLQQLEMESNGKSVTTDGQPLTVPSAAITWGGVGTDAQHAVFQLLHQGTHLIPVEFLAVIEPGHALDRAHHQHLLNNCFAQGAALMAGKKHADPARSYAGDRPSTTILLDQLTPYMLGALLAFYEHRTFVNAALLGINPFDQFGVELGKEMAKAVQDGGVAFDPSTQALIKRALGS
jgi:glucose-6-phosphate isomerase